MYISTIQRVTFSDCSVTSAASMNAGGALFVQYSKLDMQRMAFEDCSLFPAFTPIEEASSRAGGALYLLGGVLKLSNATFTRCTALPTTLYLPDCAQSYDPTSGFCSEGQGGSISVELSQVEIRDVVVTEGRACSGGFLSLNGDDGEVQFWDVYSTDMEAWSGGVYAFRSANVVQINSNRFNNSAARSNGGAITASGTLQVELYQTTVSNVSCTPPTIGGACDGGMMWATSQRYFAFLPSLSTFVDISAAGAGAIFYTHVQSVTPAALYFTLPLSKIDLKSNSFLEGSLPPPFAQYGPKQASSAVALTSSMSFLVIYPGQVLDSQLPILALTARDAYGQAMTMDRSLVVRVTSNPIDSSTAAAEHAALVTFAGTTLQSVQAATGAAHFSTGDLRVSAPPGNYTLRFSVVSLTDLFVDVELSVVDSCPAGLFYSVALRSCVSCPSALVVYNATKNACEQCPAGWQRSAPLAVNATGGPLNDGILCEVCPLGSVSTSGSSCAPCPPNTYQPTVLAACVQCSEIAGLQCAGDGLASVESGYFALSVHDGAGGSLIETFQCPDGYCSAAKVQVATVSTTDSASLAASAPALSASAVNSYAQCAYPRLSSPSNLLCGECEEGYRPWGNRCSRCDSVDGGLLFGLIVLSLVLLGWLIRSSLGSPSAGHAVVVLYFVQTAMLELGSLNTLLAWLNVVLLSPNSVGRCVAPLSPYQQTQAQILMPVALWIELMIIAMVHSLAFRRWGKVAASEGAVGSHASLLARLRAAALRFVSLFSVDLYISATLSLLLFSYTQVAVACVSYLRCVRVGSESVVFSQPSMRCESDEYAQTRALVIFALVTYVAGMPVGIAAFLWRRSDSVREAHSALVAQVQGPRVVSASVTSDSSEAEINNAAPAPSLSAPPSVSAPASASANRFLLRYAPLFAMYSSSAWFWQVIVLVRRTVFVVISVMLLPTPRRRFVAFALSTIVSLLLQLSASPFRESNFNRAEAASHWLLIVLSITLTLEDPPFSSGVNAFVFILVVPPLCLYALWAAGSTIVSVKLDRDRVYAAKEREQMELEAAIDAGLTRNPSIAHADALGVEMLPTSASARDAADSSDQARL